MKRRTESTVTANRNLLEELVKKKLEPEARIEEETRKRVNE